MALLSVCAFVGPKSVRARSSPQKLARGPSSDKEDLTDGSCIFMGWRGEENLRLQYTLVSLN